MMSATNTLSQGEWRNRFNSPCELSQLIGSLKEQMMPLGIQIEKMALFQPLPKLSVKIGESVLVKNKRARIDANTNSTLATISSHVICRLRYVCM
jgi:hypothetical protein